MLVDKKEVKTFDLTGKDGKPEINAAEFQTKLTLTPGKHEFGVELRNPSEKDPKRTLVVEYVSVEGPADTRPASHYKLLSRDEKLPHREQTKQVMERFASPRLPPPGYAAGSGSLVKLVEQAEAGGEKWEAGIQLAMQAVLVSPKFLFRVELDERPDAAGPHPIDEYQLASRLSYFLWSTMPDDELFDLAAKKQLSANLEPQVRRMLKDPQGPMRWSTTSRCNGSSFAGSTTSPPTRTCSPHFNERLRDGHAHGDRAVLRSRSSSEDRSILDLIDADFTFLNEAPRPALRHRRHQRQPAGQEAGSGPRAAPSARANSSACNCPTAARGGVLTQASVLAVTSNPTRTSPVKRGKFVLEQILGMPPPPPPPNVPLLAEDEKVGRVGARCGSGWSSIAPTPRAPIATSRWTASASRSRTSTLSARSAPRTARSTSTPRARLPDGESFQGRGRAEGDAERTEGPVQPMPGQEDVDVCHGPRRGVLRQPRGGQNRRRDGAKTTTSSRPW